MSTADAIDETQVSLTAVEDQLPQYYSTHSSDPINFPQADVNTVSSPKDEKSHRAERIRSRTLASHAETDQSQELEQAGGGDPPSPSSPSSEASSEASSPSPGGVSRGGGGQGQRPRMPVMIPLIQRVPYPQGTPFGVMDRLAWYLFLCFMGVLLLGIMSLNGERNRWLEANEATRQMVFSVKRQGPTGYRLLSWVFDNAFLNLETNSYG